MTFFIRGRARRNQEARRERDEFARIWHGLPDAVERDAAAARFATRLARAGASAAGVKRELEAAQLSPEYATEVAEWVGAQWAKTGARLAGQMFGGLVAFATGLALTLISANAAEDHAVPFVIVFYGAILGGPAVAGRALWAARKPFGFYLGLLWMRRRARRRLFGTLVRGRLVDFLVRYTPVAFSLLAMVGALQLSVNLYVAFISMLIVGIFSMYFLDKWARRRGMSV